MRRFKLNFDFLYMVLRIMSVMCFYNHSNGFSVKRESDVYSSIYLHFQISSHCCSSYVVLHDVLGITCVMDDPYTIRIFVFD